MQHARSSLSSSGSGHLRLEPGWHFKTLDFLPCRSFGLPSFICLLSFHLPLSLRDLPCSWSPHVEADLDAGGIYTLCVPAELGSVLRWLSLTLGYIFTQRSPLLFAPAGSPFCVFGVGLNAGLRPGLHVLNVLCVCVWFREWARPSVTHPIIY